MSTHDVNKADSARKGMWLRLALVVVGFTALTVPAAALAAELPGGREAGLGLTVRAVAGAAVLLLFILLLKRLVKGDAARALGLDSPRRGGLTFLGVALATAATVALVVGAALATGSATIENAGNSEVLLTMGVVVPVLMVATALPEELVFRGYLMHQLGQHFATMSAIAIQALLFTAVVSLFSILTDGLTAILSSGAMMSTFLTGVGLSYVRVFSRGLWGVLGLRLVMISLAVFAAQTGLEFSRGELLWSLALFLPLFIVALVVGSMLRPKQASTSTASELGARPRRELTQKGILYDVGTSYMPGQHSRERWNPEVVREELRVIHEDLHCTAVLLFGESAQRLEDAARMALEQGLYVWLQPRRFDKSLTDVLENLSNVAGIAERLRADYPDKVGLNIGCEVSMLHRGILPGGMKLRTALLPVVSTVAPPYIGWQLNKVLKQMISVSRESFAGPLTYAAGTWESVRWDQFDAIGANYYTDIMTQVDFRGGLRRLAAHGKPVLVTEFGCCSYEGSQDKGGSGSDIMDWSDLNDRRIKGAHQRDEQVQADHLEAQLDVFETEEVHGAFLCMFIEGDCHYSTDPTRDQDMASFGIVRPPTLESGLSADDGHWEPKRAFHALASRYKARIPAEPI